MQIPIQSGVIVRNGAFETSFPVNLEPRPMESGISKGQLVTSRGATALVNGPGLDRGGTVWNGRLYRVMGSRLVRIEPDLSLTAIGDVGDDGQPASFDYGFDRLAIRSGISLFYFDGQTLSRVTDPDLGQVIDVAWLDGYFVTTDGQSIVVTDLIDPSSVNPLRYGSAEDDPDPVTGLLRLRGEIVAFGRHSVQFFRNVGGAGFPFAVTPGASIPYGCVSPAAKCLIADTFAFVGSARQEPLGVYLGVQGTAVRVSTKEIDDLLAGVPETSIRMEARVYGQEQQLVVHLADRSLALSLRASGDADAGLWHVLHSGRFGRYRLRDAIYCYGRHICGDSDSAALGVIDESSIDHFGQATEWQFDAGLMFNEGRGLILREVELFGRPSVDPASIFFSLTRDGETWSNEAGLRVSGQRYQRMLWRPNTRVAMMAGLRFRGTGKIAITRADLQGEPLTA